LVTGRDDVTTTDRVAIVTGGSRGLGREVTRALARRGYPVVVNYARDQGAADATVDEVLATNGIALAIRADVADELDVERLFADNREWLGLVWHGGKQGGSRVLTGDSSLKPTVGQVGHMNFIHPFRIQILGAAEAAWAP
jgi:NAD(P)-dependent dehydrogenase (short-subunit alcohol dehydrogenase family)